MTTQNTIGRTTTVSTTMSTRAKRLLLEKAAVFLRVLGNAPDVRPLMDRAGYGPKMHSLGWRLYMEATGPTATPRTRRSPRTAS